MLKTSTAIALAAAIAAAITILSAPAAPVDAVPLPPQVESAMKECRQQAWPYLNCVGTPFGNPKIRVVTVERSRQN